MGGRRRSSKFDAGKYITMVLNGVAADARTAGKADIASAMDQAVLEARVQFASQTDD